MRYTRTQSRSSNARVIHCIMPAYPHAAALPLAISGHEACSLRAPCRAGVKSRVNYASRSFYYRRDPDRYCLAHV